MADEFRGQLDNAPLFFSPININGIFIRNDKRLESKKIIGKNWRE